VLDEPLQILGDGTAERDYVYEKDVCTVVQAAIAERVRGIINVGLGRSYSQSAIIGAVEELTTKTLSNVLLLPSRPSDLRRSAVDVSLLRRTLKDMHQTPLKEGLQETLLSMGYQSR
jgi:UDP-glucose 4-epimerase